MRNFINFHNAYWYALAHVKTMAPNFNLDLTCLTLYKGTHFLCVQYITELKFV